jgi:DNA mismatch repair protein MutS
VARLAGVPDAVVSRAREVLKTLEGAQGAASARIALPADPGLPRPRDLQMGLFTPAPPHPALDALKALDPNTLTPLEALQRLADLKRLAETPP